MNRLNDDLHWTDEQFSDYVLGLTSDRQASLHLEACEQCRKELDRFQESLVSFNRVSLAWGEQRSNSISRDLGVKPGISWMPVWVPTAVWAAAAVLAVGVGLPRALHRDMGTTTSQVARTQIAGAAGGTQIASLSDENSAAAIARDNKLMMEVAAELNQAEPTPMIYRADAPQEQKRRTQTRQE